jgi:hypothetical protein
VLKLANSRYFGIALSHVSEVLLLDVNCRLPFFLREEITNCENGIGNSE